ANWTFGAWYPDSARFIASIAIPGKPVSLWSVPIDGHTPEKLADIDGLQGAGSISPDGSFIAFAKNQSAIGAREIWLMGPRGESPHKILTAEYKSRFWMIAWSPAGNRIAYVHTQPKGDDVEVSVRTCDLHGTNETTILQDNALSALTWIAPSRLI